MVWVPVLLPLRCLALEACLTFHLSSSARLFGIFKDDYSIGAFKSKSGIRLMVLAELRLLLSTDSLEVVTSACRCWHWLSQVYNDLGHFFTVFFNCDISSGKKNPADVRAERSISWIDGDIRFIRFKKINLTHGAVDKAFSWKALLREVIWKLLVQSQQQVKIIRNTCYNLTLVSGYGLQNWNSLPLRLKKRVQFEILCRLKSF